MGGDVMDKLGLRLTISPHQIQGENKLFNYI